MTKSVGPLHFITENLCHQINSIDNPREILVSLFKRFEDRAAIVTSGQLSGMILIHLAHEHQFPFRVSTLDTLRLFPETYEFFEKIEKRYDICIERIKPDRQEVELMVTKHGEHLFFDSKQKQNYCCNIRKVKPMQRLLDTLDVWFTGLRRDQSAHREHVPRAEIIDHEGRSILKVSPLVDWNENKVWKFVRENDVPVNPLLKPDAHGAYFESLGCVICTTRISPEEPKRAGRWRWQNGVSTDNDKECGLHFAI